MASAWHLVLVRRGGGSRLAWWFCATNVGSLIREQFLPPEGSACLFARGAFSCVDHEEDEHDEDQGEHDDDPDLAAVLGLEELGQLPHDEVHLLGRLKDETQQGQGCLCVCVIGW